MKLLRQATKFLSKCFKCTKFVLFYVINPKSNAFLYSKFSCSRKIVQFPNSCFLLGKSELITWNEYVSMVALKNI